MPTINVNKLWQSLTGKPKDNPVHIIARRFIQAFNDHGVQTSQIPRLLSAIKLDDLKNEDHLLAALTPEIINQAAQLFGIRTEWLEGVDDEIYEYLYCYKQPEIILDHLASVVGRKNVRPNFSLRMLTTAKKLDYTKDDGQLLAPVIVEKVAELGEKDIYRYHIYRDEFDWSYAPCRVELKAIARTVFQRLHTPVPLFEISENEMREVLDGKRIPANLFRGALITNPSLEDFALDKEESRVAREIAEFPDVLQYIAEYRLQDFSFEPPPPTEQSDEPVASRIPSVDVPMSSPDQKTGKRAENIQDLWEPVRTVAAAWWAEAGDTLSIAEAIRRIKKMPHLKASAFTESAIRKHIADLAPPNVRGKSGRKPNKST